MFSNQSMHEIIDIKLGDNSKQFKKEQLQFHNHNLNQQIIFKYVTPIKDFIAKQIEDAYKTSTHIDYNGLTIGDGDVFHIMQFDDLCIKFLLTDHDVTFFLVISSRLARVLLIKLLSTTLIDENSSLLFSPTEKGVLSFIIARLLHETKNSLKNKMPSIKIMGIYHQKDEAIKDYCKDIFGNYGFSIRFADKIFSSSLLIPDAAHKNSHANIFIPDRLFSRCGHFKDYLTVALKTLSISKIDLKRLQFGDMIFFNDSSILVSNNSLLGSTKAFWNHMVFSVTIDSKDEKYFLKVDHELSFFDGVNENMEEITSLNDDNHTQADEKESLLEKLSESIRVSLSIQIARIPMTMREVCNLNEGNIIDLHRKIDDPLEIVVEGKVIGYCHPVQVDGRLGIRIIQIHGEKTTPEKC